MLKKLSLPTVALVLTLWGGFANAQATSGDPAVVSQTDYLKCMEGDVNNDPQFAATCVSGEVKRYDGAINYLYETMLKKEQFQKWNNGNGLFRGNIKDTNDNFDAFRTRFCSFYTTAMVNYSSSTDYLRQDCLLRVTKFYHQYLLQIYYDYDADLD